LLKIWKGISHPLAFILPFSRTGTRPESGKIKINIIYGILKI
jgi:hypothetical protein